MHQRNDLLLAIQEKINSNISEHKEKRVSEIKEDLNFLVSDNKASFVKLARKILKISNNKMEIEGQSIILKTVRLTGLDIPAEAMSFMPVNFDEWIEDKPWEESVLYQYFRNNMLLFFIFQQYPTGKRVLDNEMVFLDAQLWSMSEYDLTHGLKEIWDEVRRLINDNELEITKVQQKSGKIINKNNLPTEKFNLLGHLRPGAVNGEDKIKLPTGQMIVKQRFWFNKNYVKEIIDEGKLGR